MDVVDDWKKGCWERKRWMCEIGRSQICGLPHQQRVDAEVDDLLVKMVFSSTSETSIT